MEYHGLNKHSLKYRITSAVTALAILVNSMAWATYGLVINAAVSTPFNIAYAGQEDDFLENLREKYRLADPNKNYKGTALLEKLKAQEKPVSDGNLEHEIIDKYYLSPQEPSPEKDLSKYDDPEFTITGEMSGHLNSLSSSRLISTPPSVGAGNTINLNLRAKKNIKFERDANGKITFNEDANGNIIGEVELDEFGNPIALERPVVNLEKNEIASSEINHAQTNSDASGIVEGDGRFDANNFTDEEAYYEKGKEQITTLTTGTTSNALVYKSLMQAKDTNPAPQISEDNPLLTFSKDTLRDARDGEGTWGQECVEVTTPTGSEFHYPIWEERKCASPNRDNLNSCKVEREVEYPVVVDLLDGSYPHAPKITISGNKLSISFDGELGSIKDAREYNDIYGIDEFEFRECRVLEKAIRFKISEEYNVIKATRIGGKVDDIYREYIDGNNSLNFKTDYSHNNYWANIPSDDKYFPDNYYLDFPVDAYKVYNNGLKSSNYPKCERNDDRLPALTDITHLVDTTDGDLGVEFLLAVAGTGVLYVEFVFEFDRPISAKTEYTQIPEGCADAVGWVPEGALPVEPEDQSRFCSMDQWSCTSADTLGLSPENLAAIPGMYEGDDNNICLAINADGYRCEPLGQEEICTTLSDGTEHCYNWEDIKSQEDSCEPYRTDELCYESSRKCQDGWKDEVTGVCHMWAYEYKCDIGPTVVTIGTETTNQCAGAIPCTGNDCDLGPTESNDDFAQAAAYSEMLNYMSTDTSCTDPEDPSTCVIFDGDKRFCSWETTGLGSDCCEAPEGTNFYDYLSAANTMNKLALATNPAYEKWMTETTSSAWDALSEPVGEAVNEYLYEPITSAASSIASDLGLEVGKKIAQDAVTDAATKEATKSAVASANTGIFAGLQQQAMQAANQFLKDTFGEAVSDFFFQAAQDTATSAAGDLAMGEGMKQAASFMGYIMWAYMAYQMLVLLLTIISACEEEEMDMGMLIMQRQCFSIGEQYCHKEALGTCLIKRRDYCCYTSMLARIVMEQAYPLIGRDPEITECTGLSLFELEGLDWDAISLDEWIAAMVVSGIMPDEDCMNDKCLNDRNHNTHQYAITNDEKADIYSSQEWAERSKEIRAAVSEETMDCSVVPQPIACRLQVGGGG